MTKWIYESPDNGKTVFRREFGNYDKSSKLIQIAPNLWATSDELKELVEFKILQNKIHEENPNLKELWFEYITLMGLTR